MSLADLNTYRSQIEAEIDGCSATIASMASLPRVNIEASLPVGDFRESMAVHGGCHPAAASAIARRWRLRAMLDRLAPMTNIEITQWPRAGTI